MISNRSARRVASQSIAKAIRLLLQHEQKSPAEVSIVLSDDEFIRELNRTYRGFDVPTDVLSFPFNDPDVLGDIVISIDTAERQAQQREIELVAETVFLALHGCLHLLGYNDETEEGYDEMIAKARSVAAELGYKMEDDWGTLAES
ncbi:MAG: rRNA maturation RNase YbeY [bacterium]